MSRVETDRLEAPFHDGRYNPPPEPSGPMSEEDRDGGSEDIETAPASGAESGDARVRDVFAHFTDDGTVDREVLEETLTNASMVVSTAETRTELAEMALSDARETAADVDDLGVVRARLDAYEAEVTALEDRLSGLQGDHEALVEWVEEWGDPETVATKLVAVTDEARAVQRDADELQVELEEFERWVQTPETRHEELREDVAALEESVADLTDAVETLAEGETPADVDPGTAWADATLRQRVFSVFVADLRAAVADHRTWAEREGGDPDPLAAVESDLDAVARRLEDATDRLADLARPAWRDRHGDAVASFEATLETYEPPVAWGAVSADLREARDELE
jgi:polyhydroxyalkanoate synthesis regulator phasin